MWRFLLLATESNLRTNLYKFTSLLAYQAQHKTNDIKHEFFFVGLFHSNNELFKTNVGVPQYYRIEGLTHPLKHREDFFLSYDRRVKEKNLNPKFQVKVTHSSLNYRYEVRLTRRNATNYFILKFIA
jgi:hypothetical protein